MNYLHYVIQILSVVQVALLTIIAVYALGYVWEIGRNAATKHRKVCDICYREINRVNEQLARREQGKEPKI